MSSTLFFFNDTATTEIYTLSLHDALPIFLQGANLKLGNATTVPTPKKELDGKIINQSFEKNSEVKQGDRKSTRLNSSHANISYAVFCLKKKSFPPTPRAGTE